MTQIELRVPKAIEELVGDDRDRLLRTALRVAAKQRSRELATERREALARVRRYERKYHLSLAEFERKQLGALDTARAHEEYNDWFFWTRVLDRAEKASNALSKLEKVE